MNCEICLQPLSDGEISLNRRWHYACEKCQYCESSLPSPDVIEKCLTSGIPVSHTICHSNAMLQSFRASDIVIGVQQIKFLNDQMCSMFPAADPDKVDFVWIEDLLTTLTEFAANVHRVKELTKAKIQIRESRLYNAVVVERESKKKAERLVVETEKIERQERGAQLKAERENPRLRDRRKALEGWAKMLNITIDEVEKRNLVPPLSGE